jgi:hypothetical protein
MAEKWLWCASTEVLNRQFAYGTRSRQQIRGPTWSSLKTLPAAAHANAISHPAATCSAVFLRMCRSCAYCLLQQEATQLCRFTFRGHREDAVRQQLEHLLQALAVRLVPTLGQELLQVEALDRLAAGSGGALHV